jgi:hypothetical protein
MFDAESGGGGVGAERSTGAIEISSAFIAVRCATTVEVGGVVHLADQAGDAVVGVIAGEVVEQRMQGTRAVARPG